MTAESITKWLNNKHYGVCVGTLWISELLANKPRISPDEVYKQWLTTDISESHISQLPDDIGEIIKTEIIQPITLQIVSVINVGASMYSQLRKLEGKEPDAVDYTQNTQFSQREPPSSRMLFIDMTDGTTNISGMEYRPCPQLSVNTLPGTKIVISKAICRMGLILLEPGNFRILGGCVEKLRLTNTQKNLLNAELYDEPVDQGTLDSNNNQPRNLPPNNNPPQVPRPHPVTSSISNNSSISHHNNSSAMSGTNRGTSNRIEPIHSNIASSDRGVKRPLLSSSSSESKRDVSFGQKPSTAQHSVNNMNIDNQFTSNKLNNNNQFTSNKLNINKTSLSVKPESDDFSGLLDDITDEFFDEEVESPIDPSELSLTIKDITPNLKFPVYVNATIATLCSKLTPKPEWTLQCKLADFIGTKEFRLSESVLAKLIGFTSAEFIQLQPVSKTNSQIKLYLRKGLEGCQEQLKYMTGRFEIQGNTINTGSEFEISTYQELPDQEQKKQLRDFVVNRLSSS